MCIYGGNLEKSFGGGLEVCGLKVYVGLMVYIYECMVETVVVVACSHSCCIGVVAAAVVVSLADGCPG